MLEVKIKGHRGLTEKVRRRHDEHGAIDVEDLAWIERTVLEHLGHELPGALVPTARTRYRRTVLRAPDGTGRLTIDQGLMAGPVEDADEITRVSRHVEGAFIIELKSLAPRSQLLPALRRTGSRPVTLSKYAVAISSMRGVHATHWLPALRALEHAR
jgi:hypothetical protein